MDHEPDLYRDLCRQRRPGNRHGKRPRSIPTTMSKAQLSLLLGRAPSGIPAIPLPVGIPPPAGQNPLCAQCHIQDGRGERDPVCPVDPLQYRDVSRQRSSGNRAGPTAPSTNRGLSHVLGAGSLVKSGSTFTGWNTAAAGTGTPYLGGSSFIITGNISLFAQWTTKRSLHRDIQFQWGHGRNRSDGPQYLSSGSDSSRGSRQFRQSCVRGRHFRRLEHVGWRDTDQFLHDGFLQRNFVRRMAHFRTSPSPNGDRGNRVADVVSIQPLPPPYKFAYCRQYGAIHTIKYQ